MKPSSLLLAAACITMLLPVTGHAQPKPYSAGEVMEGCRGVIAKTKTEDDKLWYLRGVCMGIVSTLGEVLIAFGRETEGTTGVCIPAGETTVNQQVRVVTAYIDARPNRLDEDFRILALEAFRDAWPCR